MAACLAAARSASSGSCGGTYSFVLAIPKPADCTTGGLQRTRMVRELGCELPESIASHCLMAFLSKATRFVFWRACSAMCSCFSFACSIASSSTVMSLATWASSAAALASSFSAPDDSCKIFRAGWRHGSWEALRTRAVRSRHTKSVDAVGNLASRACNDSFVLFFLVCHTCYQGPGAFEDHNESVKLPKCQ